MTIAAKLRKVGGSIMVAIPPVYLDELALKAENQVDLKIVDGTLVIAPRRGPSYALSDLLAQCDAPLERLDEDTSWISDTPIGRELI